MQNTERGRSQEGNRLGGDCNAVVRGRWWSALGWKLRKGSSCQNQGTWIRVELRRLATGLDVRERKGEAKASGLDTQVDFSTI